MCHSVIHIWLAKIRSYRSTPIIGVCSIIAVILILEILMKETATVCVINIHDATTQDALGNFIQCQY